MSDPPPTDEKLSETPEKSGSEVGKTENPARKRIRHRKKLLYEKIMKQMEFYFSDANLAKDRFLGQLLKEDQYVPLDMFLKFNMIRSLTNDVTDIAKSLKHSTMLELSEDKTKVCRTTPICAYDAEARTIYVESVPAAATREWLRRIFQTYGPVVYISLPKYKHSQRIKGYGFIEFEKASDAEACLRVFAEQGCTLGGATPDKLASVRTFVVEQGEAGDAVEIGAGGDEIAVGNVELAIEGAEQGAGDAEPALPTSPPPKRPRRNTASPVPEQNTNIEATAPRVPRRRTKGEAGGGGAAAAGALWGLQVLAKRDWKLLRNRYLALQRKSGLVVRPAPAAPPAAAAPPAPPQPSATHLRFDDD